MSNLTSFSYAPQESYELVIKERGFLAGMGLGLAAWGILLTLTVQCLSALYARIGRRERGKQALLLYVFVMFSLGTSAIFLHLHWVQLFLIDNRNFPGGPIAYDKKYYSTPVNIVGVICYFVMNWMADGLLLWRLYVIYGSRLLVVAFPLVMYMTAISLSIVDLYTLATPGNSMFTRSAINFGLLYWSFSIALNVIVTAAIVGKLLIMRARISRISGSRHGNLYISVSTMLIESAALYTLTAILFLIGYALQNVLQFAAELLEIIQGVAPLMIILRVARGTAVEDTTTVTGPITFGNSTSQGLPPRKHERRDYPSPSGHATTALNTVSSANQDIAAPNAMSPTVHWPANDPEASLGDVEMSNIYVEFKSPAAL